MVVGEFLVLAIVVGAVLVLAVRRRSDSHKAAAEELTGSTQQLRQELERTGDEIIGRIDKQVSRLESLVTKADERCQRLREEEVRLGNMQQELAQQIAEGHILQQRLQRQTTGAGVATATDAANPAGWNGQQNYSAESASKEGTVPVANDFSAILAQSMQQKNTEDLTPTVTENESPTARFSPLTISSAQQQPTDFAQPDGQIAVSDLADTGAAKARTLLQQGLSIEDVAKETGMGRGAVELLQQMVLRQRKS